MTEDVCEIDDIKNKLIRAQLNTIQNRVYEIDREYNRTQVLVDQGRGIGLLVAMLCDIQDKAPQSLNGKTSVVNLHTLKNVESGKLTMLQGKLTGLVASADILERSFDAIFKLYSDNLSD